MKWWDESLNFVRGCTPVSRACNGCYAEANHERLLANPKVPSYSRPFNEIHVVEEMLDDPPMAHWRDPRRVFVNNLSDTFHPEVEAHHLVKLFSLMRRYDDHIYMLLTKRASRMAQFARYVVDDWPENVWAGVTIEGFAEIGRLGWLLEVPAAVRFISWEPALDNLPEMLRQAPTAMEKIAWIIMGGQTGAGTTPMPEQWARAGRDLCTEFNAALYFKQWGGTVVPPKDAPLLDGETWTQFPDVGTITSDRPQQQAVRRIWGDEE